MLSSMNHSKFARLLYILLSFIFFDTRQFREISDRPGPLSACGPLRAPPNGSFMSPRKRNTIPCNDRKNFFFLKTETWISEASRKKILSTKT